MPGVNANPVPTTRSYPSAASDSVFSSRFVPSELASRNFVLDSQITPSSMALSRPIFDRSLNPLSPRPPMSSATPTRMSEVHSSPPAALVPPSLGVSSPPQAAAMSDNATSGRPNIRSHFDKLPPLFQRF